MNAFTGLHKLEPKKRRERCTRAPYPARRGTPQDRANVIWRIERLPGRPVSLLPFLVRHPWMMGDPVIKVGFVHIRVHPDAFSREDLMVLRSGQRSEEKLLQNIEG